MNDSGGLASEILLQLDVTLKIGNYLWPFHESDVLLFSYFIIGLNYFLFLLDGCTRKITHVGYSCGYSSITIFVPSTNQHIELVLRAHFCEIEGLVTESFILTNSSKVTVFFPLHNAWSEGEELSDIEKTWRTEGWKGTCQPPTSKQRRQELLRL